MPISKEVLAQLSDEELELLKNKYLSEQTGELREQIKPTMGGFLRGTAAAFGQGLKSIGTLSRDVTKPSMTQELEEFAAKERLKNEIAAGTPEGLVSRQKARNLLKYSEGEQPITDIVPTGISDTTPISLGKNQVKINETIYDVVPTGKLDSDTGQPEVKYVESKASQLATKGEETVAVKRAERMAQMEPALRIVKDLRKDWFNAFPEAPEVGEGLSRFEHGIQKSLESFTQENPKVASYLRTRMSRLSLLVRGLGEKGVLTDRDIYRTAIAVPDQWDTKSVARMNFDELEDALNEDISNYLEKGGNISAINNITRNIERKDTIQSKYGLE